MTVKIGDKVRYSRAFLRSTGMLTGSIPFAKGTVIDITELSRETKLARIEWNDPDVPDRVNVKNLSIIGKPESV